MKIVITGASKGLGLATAKLLQQQGHHIIAVCRNKPELECTHILTDLSDDEGVELAAKQIFEEHPDVQVLINNAGILAKENNAEIEDINKVYQVNVTSLIKLTQELEQTLEKNNGHIINISSVAGLKEYANIPIYSSSKWAVRGFTQSLIAKYKQNDKLKITGIYPGVINTEIFGEKMNHPDTFMDPKDVAEVISFAITRPKSVQLSEITINCKTAKW